MPPREILFILPGPAMSVDETAYENLSAGFSGAVITASRQAALIQRREVGNYDYYCMRLSVNRRGRSRFRFPLYVISKCIGWRLRHRHFDLVVTYDPLMTGILGAICAPILGAKLVTQVNGVYTSPAQYIDDAELLSTRIRRYLFPRIERWVLSRAQGVKFLFPEQGVPFANQLEGKPIAAFLNRVNVRSFLECTESQPKRQILFAGFPFYLKGVDVLIEAFKLVSDEFPDWHLKILGWYPNQTLLLDAIGNHPRISHHPPVYPPDMPAQMAECSIFVLPSRSEAMGRVLVEAMAAGKACVGANVDGIPSVIDHELNGLLFAAEDPVDLSKKIKTLVANPELRMKLGAAAREKARTQFTDERYFERLREFYDAVLAR